MIEPGNLNGLKLKPGLCYKCYDGGIQSAALHDSVYAVKELMEGTAAEISGSYAEKPIGYSLIFEGYIKIPRDGKYHFTLESADGSMMYLEDKLLISNDEPHEKKGVKRTAVLKEGYYACRILYTSFRNKGYLKLFREGPGLAFGEMETEYLWHEVQKL